MELSTEEVGRVIVVDPGVKRIDATVAVSLKSALADLVKAGHAHIAIDLGNVEFIDSSGLGSLAAVRKQVGKSGEIALFGVQGTVKNMFKLTRMDKVFKIFHSKAEAIPALSS